MNLRLVEPPVAVTTSLGTATIENRALFRRRVMQVVTLPLTESDNFRLGDPVTVLDSGTGQPERCQVQRWAMRYPSGSERIIRLHYPAILPPNDIRITHTFERSSAGALPGFQFGTPVSIGLGRMTVVFFCGPKATHAVPVYWPGATPSEVVVDGPRCKILRYFARVYHPPQAPTVETQFWAELELHIYHDQNHMLAFARWGVDDPRIGGPGSDIEDRTGLSLEDSEVGFDFYNGGGSDHTICRPQPLQPWSNVRALDWDPNIGRWRWVWDRATQSTRVSSFLNQVYPWGTGATAKLAITCRGNETDNLRIESAEAWHYVPVYHPGIADTWRQKSSAYGPQGEMPRRQKTHEHAGTPRDAEYIRGRLEQDAWNAAQADASRYCDGIYHFNHKASNDIERLWHQNDGQTGGIHEWWSKCPHIASVQYSVPGMAHYFERALYTCPWSYFFRQVDGRILDLIDFPDMRSDRGEPATPDLALHGKQVTPRWRTISVSGYKLRDPVSGGGLVGADSAHFQTAYVYGHAAIFGDDGARRIAEQWSYGPLHLGTWNLNPSTVGQVGDHRSWARGATNWSWVLWLFGDDQRLVDRCADAFMLHATLPQLQETETRYPGRAVKVIYFFPAGYDAGVASRVALSQHDYFRTWELSHAEGLPYIARLAGHLRQELQQLEQIARWNAEAIFRYGHPRIVDEATGQTQFTFLIPGNIYAPGIATGIAANATRQLNQAEISDNNWTRCQGSYECGQPPTLDGYMKINGPGAGGFIAGTAWEILDGPLAPRDVVLTRYVDPAVRSFRRQPVGSNSYIYWFEKDLFKWMPGRADEVVQGPATVRGTHGLGDLTRIAMSKQYADNAWVLRGGSSEVQVRSVSSGSLIGAYTPSVTPSDPWTGVATVVLGGVPLVVLLDGADALLNRTSYRVVVYSEASLAAAVANWTFAFPDGLSRSVAGLAWWPQAQQLLVGANRTGEGPSLWLLAVGSGVPRRISLPMSPVQDATIILDVPDVFDIDATTDGVALVVSSSLGDRHFYIWNRQSLIWGVPRLTFVGDSASAWSNHGRDDDSLRLVTATPGTTFWEHPV